MFAIATRGMTTGDWLYALRKALENFGGVPEVVHFDNAKSMVSAAGLLPKLTERVLNFFRHYQALADTSRVGMSKDNGLGENAVKIITYRV
jgi:transposase